LPQEIQRNQQVFALSGGAFIACDDRLTRHVAGMVFLGLSFNIETDQELFLVSIIV